MQIGVLPELIIYNAEIHFLKTVPVKIKKKKYNWVALDSNIWIDHAVIRHAKARHYFPHTAHDSYRLLSQSAVL